MNNGNDIVLLGSGPINLLKAYFILKNNVQSVTIIDSSTIIGGAWYSDLSPDNNQIECGCHIWSFCPEAYNFIENELKIKLFNFKPKPVFNKGKINLSYALKSKIDSYKYIIKNSITLNVKNLKKIKNHPGIYFNLVNKSNKYPKLGSPEIINKLQLFLEADSRVTFVLNEKINAIKIRNKVELFSNKNTYTCDKVYMTSTSHLVEIDDNEKILNLKHYTADYIHYLVKLDKPPTKIISYLRLMNDKIIHRVSDISYQTHFDENLFLFGIKPESFEKFNQTELMLHISNFLKSQKIINYSHKIDLIKEHIFPTYYTDQKTRDNVNALDNSKIELIHSTDLMHGFFHLIKKHTT